MKSSSMRNLVVGTLGMLLLIAARANPARAAGDQVVGSGTGHGLVKLAEFNLPEKKGQKDEKHSIHDSNDSPGSRQRGSGHRDTGDGVERIHEYRS